jgi:hypothetical protein
VAEEADEESQEPSPDVFDGRYPYRVLFTGREMVAEIEALQEQLRQAEERAERAEERLATATQFKLAGDFVLFRTMSRQWCLVEARPIAKNPPAYFETIEEAFAAWEREKEQEPDRG